MLGIVTVSFVGISMFGDAFEVIDIMEKVQTKNEALKNTSMKILNPTNSTNDMITFKLENNGNNELWDFQKFDLFVTYNADIDGTPRITEKLSYGGIFNQIVFDAVTSFTANCASCGFSHTVTASDADKLLIVGVSPENMESLSSVTYDGQSMTKIRSDEFNNASESSLWYLVNPSIGSNTLTATFSEAGNVVIGAISFMGVNQTNPIYQHEGTTGNLATPTINVNGVCDTMITSTLSTFDGTISANSGQTDHWSTNFVSTVGVGSTKIIPTSGTYTFEWTNSAGPEKFAISTATIVPSTQNCFSNGDWGISIRNYEQRPGAVYKDQVADVRARVENPIASGSVIIQFVTDNGVAVSSFFTAP